ncbi:MAG: hypothetical protein R3301_01755 [Saprospiraceae bacterium]|nr:hypothetical protein [Saprospiraceae bacterium]
MRFQISTTVPGNYLDVMGQFDRRLFEYLAPPSSVAEIVAFTGSQTGDRVHLRFRRPWTAEWVSEITEHGQDGNSAWFVDEGTVLPFGLRFWRHRHVVERVDEDVSRIVDDIAFKFRFSLITVLAFPLVYLAFLPRRRLYKTYFTKGSV